MPAGQRIGPLSGSAAGAICTGAKRGIVTAAARACRRHVNTRLATTPLRRATSVTFAPGANVSSTIRALSPATSGAAAPTRPTPRPASPEDLKARLKVTRFAERSSSRKTVLVGCVRQVRRVTRSIRREMKRRAAVEPMIGHLEAEHRMGRNHLKGPDGDRTNAVLAAAGFNFHLLLRWLERLLRALLQMLCRAMARPRYA